MSPEPPYILAIDQSTSATKSFIYSRDGRLVERFAVEHRPLYPRAGWVEHDAEELWGNTVSVIRQALATGKEFLCLSITNQRETFVLFDRATGRPLCKAVVWQCRRGDDLCARLTANGYSKLIADQTGLKIDSYFSAPKLAAVLGDRPDLHARLAAGEALFGTIDTYLLYRLTGGRTFATDATNASRTLLFNIHTLAWSPELCALFGVTQRGLPEVRDSTARFGMCDCPEIPVRLPIAGVLGDSQAALFAHRCFQPGEAKATLGTGSSILLNTGSRPAPSGIRTVAWTHAGRATYCLEGIISWSAATIAWLRDGLGLIRSFDEVEPAAAAVPDAGGVYLVPAFAGLSAPHWSPSARAAIVGLSAASTRNHVIRAALESVAYQIKDALDSMAAEANVPLGLLHVDGGAARNGLLTQLIADMVGTDLHLSDAPDFSPLGAALAGALGMGIYDSLDQLRLPSGQQYVVKPSMPRPTAAALHAGWATAVRQVLAGCPGNQVLE